MSRSSIEEEGSVNRQKQEEFDLDYDVVNDDANEYAGPSATRTKSNHSLAETFTFGHEAAFVTVVCCAQFTTQLALGECLSILHIIGNDFGLSNPGDLSWLIAGYSLTVGTFILIGGRLGDLFGHKRMLIIGYAWFSLWSLVGGLSIYSNHVLFVFARVLQGIGPAILLPCGLALLGVTYAPGRRKNMIFSIFGATAPTGCIVGCIFSALFALAWWPWMFFAQAIFLALLAVAGYFAIPSAPPRAEQKRSLREKIEDLDLLGAATGVAGLVLFNFAWNQAAVAGWSEPYVYVCLILGILFFGPFIYIEKRVAKSPLIPFDALTGTVAYVLGCVACGWASFGIFIYYIWQFFEELRGASPLQGSAWVTPLAPMGMIAAITTGFLIHKLGPAYAMVVAMIAFTVGNILIATAPVGQTYWAQSFVCCLVIVWGMDVSFPAATLTLSNAVKKEHQGIGASLVNTVVNYSISIGLGIAGTVEGHVNGGGNTKEELLKGYRGALYVAIGLAGLGLVLSSFFAFTHGRKGK